MHCLSGRRLMPEQLTMDLNVAVSPSTEIEEPAVYEALDYQLAELLQSLNGKPDTVLQHFTLEISKHAREGQIAIICTPQHQAALLSTQVVGKAGDYKPLIIDQGYLYMNRYWHYQQQLAAQLRARMDQQGQSIRDNEWIKGRLDHYFAEQNSTETDWQRLAAQQALQNNFLILSGGPGTGKTTTITRILALLIEQHGLSDATSPLRIALAAPTGKAAIRMLDSIRKEQQTLNLEEKIVAQMPKHASTLHKLLGFIPQSVVFKHHENNPLNADVVLLDEASMVDIALLSKLLEAVPPQAKLILIGDKDQLASVETGSVFADLCDAFASRDPLEREATGEAGGATNSHMVTLKKNWRFAKDSGIGQLAIAVNSGDSSRVLEILDDENKPECALVSPHVIAHNRLPADLLAPWQNYFEVLNNRHASIAEIFAAFNRYRILCALRRGLNGSSIMSKRIEEALGRQGFIALPNAAKKSQHWYHGRPVMVTQNSYSKGLFNGDTGITLVDKAGQAKVWFPDVGPDEKGAGTAFESFAPVRLPAHETTWAMTIHKSQGSEFDEVALILPHEEMPLLTRQLIYTGVTRARKKVGIIATADILSAGIKAEVVSASRISHMLHDKG